jgi:hypothetical protein
MSISPFFGQFVPVDHSAGQLATLSPLPGGTYMSAVMKLLGPMTAPVFTTSLYCPGPVTSTPRPNLCDRKTGALPFGCTRQAPRLAALVKFSE